LLPCFPKAVRVDFGKWAIVLFFLAARAAFLIFFCVADLCLDEAITVSFMWSDAQGRKRNDLLSML
jgi:hypothetical protein